MFDRFASTYRPDPATSPPAAGATLPDWVTGATDFQDFMSTAAHGSFDHGLLRFLHATGSPSAADANGPGGWLTEWPSARDRLWVFAYDWLGRLYGFDRSSSTPGGSGISRLDAGVGEILVAEVDFQTFVTGLLVDQRDDILATDYFEDWRAHGGRDPAPTECVGFRVPLFLGGRDEIGNLEVSAIRVYLSLQGQLASQVAKVPPGSAVADVELRERPR